jgi:hypothetical protein
MNTKKKEVYKRLIILAVTGFLCLTTVQLSALSTAPQHRQRNFEKATCTNNLETRMGEKTTILQDAITGNDVLIFGYEDLQCQYPTITDDGGGGILLCFEGQVDIFTSPDTCFRYSTDGGTTWLPEDAISYYSWVEGNEMTRPRIDFAGDNGAFGTLLPNKDFGSTDWVTLNLPVITDPEPDDEDPWEPRGWIASAMMSEWHSCDACGVSTQYAPDETARGIAIWTGDTLDGGTNNIFFGWEIPGDSFTVYEEDTDLVYECDNAVNDADLSTGMYYQAFYRFDDVSDEQLPDGVFLRWAELDGTADWAENWTDTRHIPGANYPDIKADGGNCYVVYEIDGGIGCTYSNDNAGSFQTVTITNDARYPSVTAIGKTVVVSYIRDGNLFTALSDDGGTTWVESAPVNDVPDSVLEEPLAADVSSTSVVWTDDRDGYNAVYFDKAEAPVAIIEIQSIAGGFGVSAVVKNTGYAEGTNIDWSITLEGGAFVGKETTGTIASLPPGETATIASNLILGIGATEITVTAGSATRRASGTVFLFFVLGL